MSPNPVQGTFVPSPLPGTQLSLKPPESRPLCIALFCHGRFKLNSPHSPKLLLKPPRRGFNIYLDKRIMPLQKPSCRASCRLQASQPFCELPVSKTKHYPVPATTEHLHCSTSAFLGRHSLFQNLTTALVLFCFAFEINELWRNVR